MYLLKKETEKFDHEDHGGLRLMIERLFCDYLGNPI